MFAKRRRVFSWPPTQKRLQTRCSSNMQMNCSFRASLKDFGAFCARRRRLASFATCRLIALGGHFARNLLFWRLLQKSCSSCLLEYSCGQAHGDEVKATLSESKSRQLKGFHLFFLALFAGKKKLSPRAKLSRLVAKSQASRRAAPRPSLASAAWRVFASARARNNKVEHFRNAQHNARRPNERRAADSLAGRSLQLAPRGPFHRTDGHLLSSGCCCCCCCWCRRLPRRRNRWRARFWPRAKSFPLCNRAGRPANASRRLARGRLRRLADGSGGGAMLRRFPPASAARATSPYADCPSLDCCRFGAINLLLRLRAEANCYPLRAIVSTRVFCLRRWRRRRRQWGGKTRALFQCKGGCHRANWRVSPPLAPLQRLQ